MTKNSHEYFSIGKQNMYLLQLKISQFIFHHHEAEWTIGQTKAWSHETSTNSFERFWIQNAMIQIEFSRSVWLFIKQLHDMILWYSTDECMEGGASHRLHPHKWLKRRVSRGEKKKSKEKLIIFSIADCNALTQAGLWRRPKIVFVEMIRDIFLFDGKIGDFI